MAKNSLYLIGSNSYGQLGTNDVTDLKKLTNWNTLNPNISIKTVHCGSDHSIFTDINGSFWSSGQNNNGQCGIGVISNNVIQCTQIDYFKMRNINIQNICTNACTDATFWISNKHQLYGNGLNSLYQLGFGDANNRSEPELIDSIKNVIDVSCSYNYSIALCKSSLINDSIIIEYWIRQNNIEIPNDIIKIIKLFGAGSDCLTAGSMNEEKRIWTKIKVFEEGNITKISGGHSHSLFMESNGNIWCFGQNLYGQLGIGCTVSMKEPTFIPFFVKHKVCITQIACGWYHSLCIDNKGNVYSFGRNDDGQCGHGTMDHVLEPKTIEAFSDCNIVDIKCGAWHSYARDDQDKHYLFGENSWNRCSLVDGTEDRITTPFCINTSFAKLTNNKTIKSVELGRYSTMIVAS